MTVVVVCASELSTEELFAQEEGLEKWREFAGRALTVEKNEAIEKLAEGIRKTSRPNIYSIEGTKEVALKLKAALLSIPGHAEYYQNKIESLRAEVLANSRKSEAEIGKMQDEGQEVVHSSDYERFCSMYAFPTLSLLPSAETVRVLGSYLNDPVGRDGKTLTGGPRTWPGNDSDPFPCNAEMATSAIRNLGIEHPPFPPRQGRVGKSMSDSEVDAWKDWWNEVKGGRRTYRFIGSPIEYGPDGPASIEVVQRAQRNMKRDEERSVGHQKATRVTEPASVITQISKPSSIAGVVAALALVSAAVWYFLKGREVA